jgi:aspartyl-tRNA(Asn)/glutamyl-tRNA(Gln) amidotransferase subunit A
VRLKETAFPVFNQLANIFVDGGIVGAEAFAWHRDLIEKAGRLYDPRVLVRILRAKNRTHESYIALRQERARLIAQWEAEAADVDAVLMPTIPVVPPTMRELEDDDAYGRVNLLVLRNPTVVSALDGCAISLTCHAPGEAPVGLMLAAPGGRDFDLLRMAAALEPLLAQGRGLRAPDLQIV